MNRRTRDRSWRDDRAWQAGILIGSALGAAATVVGRLMERTARQGLVDWPSVERLAVDPTERERLGTAARAAVLAQFDLRDNAAELGTMLLASAGRDQRR